MVTALDIANRALQRVGALRIASTTEVSKNAKEFTACYDLVRRAELRRNNWKFAIRRVALRAVDTDTVWVTPAAYAGNVSYVANDLVTSGNLSWMATGNTSGSTPGDDSAYWNPYCGPRTAQPWDGNTSYFTGELVTDTSGNTTSVFISLIDQNEGNTSDPASWFETDATNYDFALAYPIGAGPASQFTSKNVFVLPANYLRDAPQDPKAGSQSPLGAPSNTNYSDFLFENEFIVSATPGPMIFRFLADITKASMFDPMFVEGLSARIAAELAQPLTQSGEKKSEAMEDYKKFMGEARIVNAIEVGPVEPALDDYLACRV